MHPYIHVSYLCMQAYDIGSEVVDSSYACPLSHADIKFLAFLINIQYLCIFYMNGDVQILLTNEIVVYN